MIDMKTEGKPKGETALTREVGEPEYPWGLRVTLTESELKKLGITEMPALDSEHKLVALACVIAVSQYEADDSDGKQRSLTLQIEQMALAPAAEEDDEKPEGKLYRSSAV